MNNTPEKTAQALGRSRTLRAGGYSVVATVVVIVIAVFVNLLVARLPASYTKLDMTADRMFEISDQTKKVLAGLEQNIDIYLITQPSQEDTYVRQLLELYAGMSTKITLHNIDPVVYPNFGAQYTSDTVYNNSLVVECGDRSRYVGLLDIYLYEMDYTTGEYTEDWNGENALTSAIDYVTSDDLPVVYTLTGHGETALNDTIVKKVGNQNMEVSELQLLTNAEIPEDADTLIINAPTADLAPDEVEIIKRFLARGGKLMLMTNLLGYDLPNLEGLMAEYGVSLVPGIVIEGNMNNCLRGEPYLLLPYMRYHDATAPLVDGGYRALLPLAQGLRVDEALRAGVSVTPLLVTSEQSFSKQAGFYLTTYEKEDGDIDGPFNLAVAIEDTTTSARIVWFTTAQGLDDSVDVMVSGANHDLFLNALGWMNQRENTISIHAKRLEQTRLVVPSSDQTRLSIIFIGGFPLLFLAFGIYISVRRRRA